MADKRLTITIRRTRIKYEGGRWGAPYHYESIDNPYEGADSPWYKGSPHRSPTNNPIRVNHGCTSVTQITDILRRKYGKNTRIVQEWDGKERK